LVQAPLLIGADLADISASSLKILMAKEVRTAATAQWTAWIAIWCQSQQV
jgi:hypothetical protein